MNPNCKYEVHTHWGCFRLDEGAYQDYLAGKLWISWVPGKAKQSSEMKTAPADASKEAISLREQAAKEDAFTVFVRSFPEMRTEAPYKEKMKDASIDEMSLSVRSNNGLMRAGANTFGKVKEIIERENGLLSLRNLGAKSEKEISVCFFNGCYMLLNDYEKAAWWQEQLNCRTVIQPAVNQ